MNRQQSRIWRVLCWNVRGLNADSRHRALRSKIEESQATVVCIQETKCEYIDHKLLRKFCPKRFDNFAYIPSKGASGGLLILWCSAIFSGKVIEIADSGIMVEFTSVHNGHLWTLVSVYGPCKGVERDNFVSWLYGLQIPVMSNWLLLGDFNFIRSPDNRNKPGGDVNEMFIFNDIIGHLGLVELPLKGRAYTWSNMQAEPLLEQLDWFFTSPNWVSDFPDTVVLPLANTASDHVPCVVNICTTIPKASIFRFENFWAEQAGFLECVSAAWERESLKRSSAGVLADKFKALRYSLKNWHKSLSKLKAQIENCNKVVAFMDYLEEQRPLFLPEFNFRKIVKLHLEDLLLIECNYWRKRCTVRWIKLGEDNTKFFHAMATTRFRRNSIAMLRGDDGLMVSEHEEMAGLLWAAYKNRMGLSEGIDMQFQLNDLFEVVPGLDSITVPFSREEMDLVVKQMPPDKSPGPDGFNGLFLKKCWPIIKEDFYRLADDFHSGGLQLQNINGSFITLVPKCQSPVDVNDFRPISLTNVCLKFLTKLVANRLQDHILRCIHKNQYGFLKSRSIQDCVAWAFEYLHLCHVSKRPVIVLKLDFAKAFDTIEHEAILQVMRAMGFNELMLRWVKEILSSGTSSILLNGVPGKQFVCKRGVRQGDPLSPLLYVLGSELLQVVVNKLMQDGEISLPIQTNDPDFPILQYADDTLLVLPADLGQVLAVKSLLQKFSVSTGLKINYHKSTMVPINVDSAQMEILANGFGCKVESPPFTYLGLPMGTTRPKIIDLMPIVTKLERRLCTTSCFLSQGARLQLISSALSSMPVYFMCSLQLPAGIIAQLDRILRQCLWRGNSDTPKQALAAWDMLCKPKMSGGVGIVNFKRQNEALLLKHLDKFYNNSEVPWVQLIWFSHYQNMVPHAEKLCGSFWWRDIMKLVNDYRAVSVVQPGRGNSFLFWSDKWLFNGSCQPIADRYPRLFSYVLDPLKSAAEVYEAEDLSSLFYLPLSAQAYQELVDLSAAMQASPLSMDRDAWVYVWGPVYTSARYYKHLHAEVSGLGISKWIWKSSCIMRTKFFAWLLLNDRLNTKDLLKRRNWQVTDDYHCVLCPNRSYEDRMHLFFVCNFSYRIWTYLQIDWSLGQDIQSTAVQARKDFKQPFFMEVVILACWNIWKQRNGKIFEDERPSFAGWKRGFVHDISMLEHRIKSKHKQALIAWIGSLL